VKNVNDAMGKFTYVMPNATCAVQTATYAGKNSTDTVPTVNGASKCFADAVKNVNGAMKNSTCTGKSSTDELLIRTYVMKNITFVVRNVT